MLQLLHVTNLTIANIAIIALWITNSSVSDTETTITVTSTNAHVVTVK